MEKIYLITGFTGEYDDYVEWIYKGFRSKEDAEYCVSKFNSWLKNNNVLYDQINSVDYDTKSKLECLFKSEDSKIQIDYTGTKYYIQEVELI